MQANERIEEQQRGPQRVDGGGEPFLVAQNIEPQRRDGDDVDVERGDVEVVMQTQRVDARAHYGQRIFGQIDERRSWIFNREATPSGVKTQTAFSIGFSA